MSYTPTQWQTGDTITAEKLNNMESGIENANEPFIVTLTPTAADMSGTMDKTVGEIYEAWMAGKRIVFKVGTGGGYIYADCTMQSVAKSDIYPSFNGYVIVENVLIFVRAGATSDPDDNSYATNLYALFPKEPS